MDNQNDRSVINRSVCYRTGEIALMKFEGFSLKVLREV